MPFASPSLGRSWGGIPSATVRSACCLFVISGISAIPVGGAEVINALLIGAVDGGTDLEVVFGEGPLINCVSVPAVEQGWGSRPHQVRQAVLPPEL